MLESVSEEKIPGESVYPDSRCEERRRRSGADEMNGCHLKQRAREWPRETQWR